MGHTARSPAAAAAAAAPPAGGFCAAQAGEVYVNVYHVAAPWVNSVLDTIGVGVFHTGVEVNGVELGFGRTVDGGSGVYRIRPRSYEHHVFHDSIYLGRTQLPPAEVAALFASFREQWGSEDYHVLHRNCNTFSECLCHRLLDRTVDRRPFPLGLNRTSRAVACLLSESMVQGIESIDRKNFERWRDDQRLLQYRRPDPPGTPPDSDADDDAGAPAALHAGGAAWSVCDPIATPPRPSVRAGARAEPGGGRAAHARSRSAPRA